MEPSDWIAILALVIASLSFGWTLRRDLAKRPRIETRWWLGHEWEPGAQSELLLIVTVKNFSEYSVTINGAGGELDDGMGGFFTNPRGDRIVGAK